MTEASQPTSINAAAAPTAPTTPPDAPTAPRQGTSTTEFYTSSVGTGIFAAIASGAFPDTSPELKIAAVVIAGLLQLAYIASRAYAKR